MIVTKKPWSRCLKLAAWPILKKALGCTNKIPVEHIAFRTEKKSFFSHASRKKKWPQVQEMASSASAQHGQSLPYPVGYFVLHFSKGGFFVLKLANPFLYGLLGQKSQLHHKKSLSKTWLSLSLIFFSLVQRVGHARDHGILCSKVCLKDELVCNCNKVGACLFLFFLFVSRMQRKWGTRKFYWVLLSGEMLFRLLLFA